MSDGSFLRQDSLTNMLQLLSWERLMLCHLMAPTIIHIHSSYDTECHCIQMWENDDNSNVFGWTFKGVNNKMFWKTTRRVVMSTWHKKTLWGYPVWTSCLMLHVAHMWTFSENKSQRCNLMKYIIWGCEDDECMDIMCSVMFCIRSHTIKDENIKFFFNEHQSQCYCNMLQSDDLGSWN